MKLSEMNTREAAKAMCALVRPMQNIAKNKEVNRAFAAISGKGDEAKDMTVLEKGGMLLEIVPILLEACYADTIAIISVMTGKMAGEIEEQNIMKTIADVREFMDDEFMSFFKSPAVMKAMK